MMEREQIEQMQEACARLARQAAGGTSEGPAADALREWIGQVPDLMAECLHWVDAVQAAQERIPRLRARCRRLTELLEKIRQRLEDHAGDSPREGDDPSVLQTAAGSSCEAAGTDLSDEIEPKEREDGDDGPAETDREVIDLAETVGRGPDDGPSDSPSAEEEKHRCSAAVRHVGERSEPLGEEVLPADALLDELEAIDGELSHCARATRQALSEMMDLDDSTDDEPSDALLGGRSRSFAITSSARGPMRSGSGMSRVGRVLDGLPGVGRRGGAATGWSLPDFDDWLEELDRIEMDLLGD